MQTGTHANPGSIVRPEARVRDFTAMLEVEIAGDHIDLPSFPEVALRVRRALADEDVSIDQVVRVVSAEPSLVVRLLQLGELGRAQSQRPPADGSARRDHAHRLQHGAQRHHRVRHVAAAARGSATRASKSLSTSCGAHSTQVAAVSFVVAKRLTKVNAELALLAGLLHTVGKLYLLTRAARFPDLLNDAAAYPALVQAWHARIARAILVNWEMAPPVIDAVQGFEACDREREGEIDLLDVLWVGRAWRGAAAGAYRRRHPAGAARVPSCAPPRARRRGLRGDPGRVRARRSIR